MSALISVTSDNFDNEIKKATKPVVIDVYATWCGPCQHMAPYVEELANEYADRYIFAKLNVDEAQELAVKFGVSAVPTFVFMKQGAVVGTEVGYMNKNELLNKIKHHLG